MCVWGGQAEEHEAWLEPVEGVGECTVRLELAGRRAEECMAQLESVASRAWESMQHS